MALVVQICGTDLADVDVAEGFHWPKPGQVECPHVDCTDWNPDPKSDSGFRGLLWGVGMEHDFIRMWDKDDQWVVVLVDEADLIVYLHNEVRYPRGEVVFCGDRKGATDYILANGGAGKAVVGAFVSVGDCQMAVSGVSGASTSGFGGISVSGDFGAALSEAGGLSMSCGWGVSMSGDFGVTLSGVGGEATAGKNGNIQIWYFDETGRRRLAVGYIGENGLEPNVPYKLNEKHEFVRAE